MRVNHFKFWILVGDRMARRRDDGPDKTAQEVVDT